MSDVPPVDLPPWARGLGLRAHPEGGWYAETWRSTHEVPASALTAGRYPGPRALGTAILYLLLPGQTSAWHVVASDELWLHHRGGPLVLGLGGADPAGPGPVEEHVLGDPAEGASPQVLVPGGVWQTARPAGADEVLVGCVVVPGFDFADFRLAP